MHVLSEAGREVEREGCFGVFACGGEGEHLSEPEGEREGRAGFEAAGRVVEVAEVRDVELESAGDFLGGVS